LHYPYTGKKNVSKDTLIVHPPIPNESTYSFAIRPHLGATHEKSEQFENFMKGEIPKVEGIYQLSQPPWALLEIVP